MKIPLTVILAVFLFGIIANCFVIQNYKGLQVENAKNQKNLIVEDKGDEAVQTQNKRNLQIIQILQGQPNSKFDNLMALRDFVRSIDGTNNGANFNYGKAFTSQGRLAAPNYKPGQMNAMRDDLPLVRQVSNLVGNLVGPTPTNRDNLNMLFPIWGQFLDHDISLNLGGTQSVPIKIPNCDAWLDKTCTNTQTIPFRRSGFTLNSNGVRTQTNRITAWVDGSAVYGSDSVTAAKLRSFVNGKLKTGENNLLPKQNGVFIAGDTRVNQNVGLTAMHTIFMREHNRICDFILSKDSSFSDEQIYNAAKNYVTALIQHITYDEFLPTLLGRSQFDSLIGPYVSTNDDPTLSTEFSTAGFRLGHTFINAPFNLISNNGQYEQTLSLGEMFSNPNFVTPTTLTQLLNGMIRTNAKQRSLELVNDLRNFLTLPSAGSLKLDLFSLNLQRGRDHGIGSVQQVRQALGLNTQATFNDIFQNQQKAEKLRFAYGSLNNVDLWLAIIGQKPLRGSQLGQIGNKLVGQQFKRIRNGDKNWYQNIFTDKLIQQIKKTSLGDIIKRNTEIKNVNPRSFIKFP